MNVHKESLVLLLVHECVAGLLVGRDNDGQIAALSLRIHEVSIEADMRPT